MLSNTISILYLKCSSLNTTRPLHSKWIYESSRARATRTRCQLNTNWVSQGKAGSSRTLFKGGLGNYLKQSSMKLTKREQRPLSLCLSLYAYLCLSLWCCAQLPASWKKGKRKALSLSQHALSRSLPAAGTRLDYSSHVFLASPRPAAATSAAGSAGAGASNRLLHEDVRSLGYRSLLDSSGSVSSFGFVVPAVRFQRRLAGNFGLATDSVGVPVSGCAVSCLFLLCTEPSSAKSGVESPSLYARARARVCVCVCASDSTSDCDCDCEGNGDCDCHCDCHCDCVRVCVWVYMLACVCVCEFVVCR